MSKETLLANLREIPDFPIPGILFYDVTTLFKSAECMQEMLDTLYEMYKDKGITKVVGIESRGFIMGGALAARLGAGFVMARKPGKLPAEVLEETYAKEYGTDTIQIHKDAISEEDVVLLHDDLLATGGTMAATHRLVQESIYQFHYRIKRTEREKGISCRYHSGYTAAIINFACSRKMYLWGCVKTKPVYPIVSCRGRGCLPEDTKQTVFGRANLTPTNQTTVLSRF